MIDVENSRLRTRKAEKEGKQGSKSNVPGRSHPRSTYICDDEDVLYGSLYLSTNSNVPRIVYDGDELNIQLTELCTSKNNVISPHVAFTRVSKLT